MNDKPGESHEQPSATPPDESPTTQQPEATAASAPSAPSAPPAAEPAQKSRRFSLRGRGALAALAAAIVVVSGVGGLVVGNAIADDGDRGFPGGFGMRQGDPPNFRGDGQMMPRERNFDRDRGRADCPLNDAALPG